MATINTNGSGGGNSSMNTTYAGLVHPAINDTVVVEDDDILLLDEDFECGDGVYVSDSSPYSPSSNFRLWLKGTLKASRTVDSSLAVKGMIGADVGSGWESTLDFGTEADPIPADINFTWHMNKSGFTGQGYYFGVGFYSRSTSRMAKIFMRSAKHRVRNVWLTQSYAAGVTEIEVNDATGWEVGDELILTPQWTLPVTADPRTNYDYDEVTITSVSGTTIGITATTYPHGYDDANDIEAGAVSNITSNVILTGDGDDRIFPSIYNVRGVNDYKDVGGRYMNNRYSLNTCCLRMVNGGVYQGSYDLIESCAFGVDARGLNDSMNGVIYFYAPNQRYSQSQVKDVVIFAKMYGTQKITSMFRSYYGGRNSSYEDCNGYGMTRYCDAPFSNYQQPSTYTHCKAFNSTYGFQLHDNVDTDTYDCWSVGSLYNTNTYNGTAFHNDLHVRFSRYLAYFLGGWRGKFVARRWDFDDEHVYTSSDNYVYYGADLPDGNLYKFEDLQGDSNKQQWYYSFGRKWWKLTETRNDPYSFGMKSTSDTYVVPHERTFAVSTGDAVNVGLFVKNLSASYIGTLTITVLQGSTVITTKDFDLTTLTADEWTYLSTGGVATKTMTTTFRIEYKGDGGEIAITDFKEPFNIEYLKMGEAFWSLQTSENKVAGSFGEAVGSMLKWIYRLRSILRIKTKR